MAPRILLAFLNTIDILMFGLVRRTLVKLNLNRLLGIGPVAGFPPGVQVVEVPTVRTHHEPDLWDGVYDALSKYPYDQTGEVVQQVVELYWDVFFDEDKALEICSFVNHEFYATDQAAHMELVLKVYNDPRAKIDLIRRLAQELPGPIQLNLRGNDEAVPDDTMEGACAVCHVKKACVLLSCCGKVLFCNSCAQNLYQGKEVGTMQCMNCQGIVTQGQTILF
eukprot:CAMPEP_0113446886 /NCGR_PEP_ID=MMETSP0014_2-20120614/3949_1 /TAXON_ID=2857 /ORGANISM="Nitzschia sp." /LENGTH=221 /DNA_ID=CAMNT_0000338015 /DNA_START=222 /DNA_END=890 /DNA_ORIENTATION=+ /assembly_acc=CAM_ASM_000159